MNSADHLKRIGELTGPNGPRDRTHGSKVDTFAEIGRRWAQHLGVPKITPEQVAICMIEMKLVRAVGRICEEHLVDAAGYAGCALEILDDK